MTPLVESVEPQENEAQSGGGEDGESSLPLVNLPRPVPLTEKLFQNDNSPSVVTALIEQARDLRFRGDIFTALIKLREAKLIEPRNPMVLAETAATYEQLEVPDEATKFWKELYNLGEGAGVMRDLAAFKLRMMNSLAMANRQAELGVEAVSGSERDTHGLRPNAAIGFRDIVKEENVAPDDEVFITVRLKVSSRPGGSVDASEVAILVYFYEVIDDEYIVQTNADVAYHWISLPADWRDSDNTEVLEVDYHQKAFEKEAADASKEEEETTEEKEEGEGESSREFYGYIARIYYKGDLQDVAAEPVSLLNQFPPPNTLPSG